MKLTIPKKELKKALIMISKVVSGKSSLPIVNAVKISGDKDTLRVTGTNLEQTLTCKLSGGEGGGSFIIDLKELKDYLKQHGTSATVQFEDIGDKISAIFHAGNTPVIKQFNTFPIDEWPELPEIYNKGYSSEALFARIHDAVPSASKDSTRKMLHSILLESDAIVATNGRELVRLNCPTGSKESVAIPVTKFIQSANFAKSRGSIAVQELNGVLQCRFESDNWIYTTKCVDGNYPNYKQVIPKTNECSIEFSPESIASLLKSIPELESDEEFQTVHLYADDKQIIILPSDYTSKALTVDGIFKGKNPVTVSINRELLLRALNLGFTTLSFTDSNGFAPIMAKDSKGLFVFMPLQGMNVEKIKNAVKVKDSDKCLSFHGKKPDTEVYTPVTPVYNRDVIENKQAERSMNRPIKNETVKAPLKKEDKMPEEIKRPPVFKVVEGKETDPFIRLAQEIIITQEKAKAVVEHTKYLSRLVKDVQREVKSKEKDFKNTRDLLVKLKKVSGF